MRNANQWITNAILATLALLVNTGFSGYAWFQMTLGVTRVSLFLTAAVTLWFALNVLVILALFSSED